MTELEADVEEVNFRSPVGSQASAYVHEEQTQPGRRPRRWTQNQPK